jgi:hypothetical protein
VSPVNSSQVVQLYAAAWAESDEKERLRLLTRCWADDGVYLDPITRVEGRQALVEHIGGYLVRQAGQRIELTSEVDAHDGYLRSTFVVVGPDGAKVLEGIDFGEFDDAGVLRRIVGFFGSLPVTGMAG